MKTLKTLQTMAADRGMYLSAKKCGSYVLVYGSTHAYLSNLDQVETVIHKQYKEHDHIYCKSIMENSYNCKFCNKELILEDLTTISNHT